MLRSLQTEKDQIALARSIVLLKVIDKKGNYCRLSSTNKQMKQDSCHSCENNVILSFIFYREKI